MNYLKSFRYFFLILIFNIIFFLSFSDSIFAQETYIDFNLDITSKTKATPTLVNRPGVDLSGRGFHDKPTWPQNLAAPEAIDNLEKNLDLRGGIFRIQFDLWEFIQLAKNKEMQARLLSNYAEVIKNINAVGGIAIVNLYGMPPGLGKVLDKKSSPWDLRAFKELVKNIIRYLSCEKGYDVWYEVWNAPDLEDFFLGEKREYLSIYKAVAEGIQELEKVTKRNIPLGGPGVTWWFQNLEGNSIFYPEKSLIYEFIRFCAQKRLPLDFISWHAYTSDPFAESEITRYKKTAPELMRDWLTYFSFDSTTPLIISEWNYDRGVNFEPQRGWESYVAASYIPSRIRNMVNAGIDYQIFYCLEDFKNNKEGVNRNLGLFWFEPKHVQYSGGPKTLFNIVRMLNMLGSEMFLSSRLDNQFVGIIATKTKTGIALLLFNYIDPEIARNYLSRQMIELHPKLAKNLVSLINSDKWGKILNKQIPLKSLRVHKRIKSKIQEAIDLNQEAKSAINQDQLINLNLNKLDENYIYKKYIVDKTCSLDCLFTPVEEKEIRTTNNYKEILQLQPYSVVLIILDKESSISITEKQELPEENEDSQDGDDAQEEMDDDKHEDE